jgi:hypothetical protein
MLTIADDPNGQRFGAVLTNERRKRLRKLDFAPEPGIASAKVWRRCV